MAFRRYYFSDKLMARRARNLRIKICLTVLAVFAVSAGTAWSRDLVVCASPVSPLSVVDSCLPLLQSIRTIAPDAAPDKTQRPAGTQVVLYSPHSGRLALGSVSTPPPTL